MLFAVVFAACNQNNVTIDNGLKKYFDEHAFKTITTEQFLDYLRANLLNNDKALEDKINIKAWVYGPGIPANCPRVDAERFNKVDAEREKFLGSFFTTTKNRPKKRKTLESQIHAMFGKTLLPEEAAQTWKAWSRAN